MIKQSFLENQQLLNEAIALKDSNKSVKNCMKLSSLNLVSHLKKQIIAK